MKRYKEIGWAHVATATDSKNVITPIIYCESFQTDLQTILRAFLQLLRVITNRGNYVDSMALKTNGCPFSVHKVKCFFDFKNWFLWRDIKHYCSTYVEVPVSSCFLTCHPIDSVDLLGENISGDRLWSISIWTRQRPFDYKNYGLCYIFSIRYKGDNYLAESKLLINYHWLKLIF
jgi:hypothetical protein